MNLVRSTNGAWWRDQLFRYTVGLIDVHKTTANKVIGIQLGNEINADDYATPSSNGRAASGSAFPIRGATTTTAAGISETTSATSPSTSSHRPCRESGRPTPKPRCGPDPDRARQRRRRARHVRRNHFIPALLNYRIDGAFAPALRGKRVKDVVDYMSIHYLLTPENIFGYSNGHGVPLPYGSRKALSDMHTRWVGNARIKGVWHTEEGGVRRRRRTSTPASPCACSGGR